jgi:hypothetical protein
MIEERHIEKFWNKVDVIGKEYCWEWTGGVIWKNSIEIRHKYGRFYFDGKVMKSHIFSYIITYGELPHKHVVRHKCDNPICCNPNHLISGTQYENDMDRTQRGRSRNKHTGRIG